MHCCDSFEELDGVFRTRVFTYADTKTIRSVLLFMPNIVMFFKKVNSALGEREREFIGTNIEQFHAIIKLRRWDTEKNLQNRLSRRAPLESFINFYRGLKLMAELVRIQ